MNTTTLRPSRAAIAPATAALLVAVAGCDSRSVEQDGRNVWEATEYSVARVHQELPFSYYGFDISDTTLHVSRRWLRGGMADQSTPDVIVGTLGGRFVEHEQSPWPCCQTMTVYSQDSDQLIALFSSNAPVAAEFPASK